MKYCPYCGAALVGGAASFCVECGKPMPPAAAHTAPTRDMPARPGARRKQPPASKTPPAGIRKPSLLAAPPKKPILKNKRPYPQRQPNKRAEPIRAPKRDPCDEGYDGYYDDVLPIDNGDTRDRMDSNLIKRAVIIGAGALLIVILSVIVMSVL